MLDVSGARCPGCWMSGVLDVQGVIFEFGPYLKLCNFLILVLDVLGAGCLGCWMSQGAGCPRVLDVPGCWMSGMLDVPGAGCPGVLYVSGC